MAILSRVKCNKKIIFWILECSLLWKSAEQQDFDSNADQDESAGDLTDFTYDAEEISAVPENRGMFRSLIPSSGGGTIELPPFERSAAGDVQRLGESIRI